MDFAHSHWIASPPAWEHLVVTPLPLPDSTGFELAVHSKRIRFLVARLPSCPFSSPLSPLLPI